MDPSVAPFPQRRARSQDRRDTDQRKRGKYTQVACNECKRRKLKCSGEEVCRRCAGDGTACVYALQSLSAEPQNADKSPQSASRINLLEYQMLDMQQQLRSMSAQIRDLQRNAHAQGETPPRIGGNNYANAARFTARPPMSPAYVGPTSAEFGLHVAGQGDTDETDDTEEVRVSWSPSPSARTKDDVAIFPENPLMALTETDSLRLVDVYEEAIGIMYPVVDTASIRKFVVDYYRHRISSPSDAVLHKNRQASQDWWFFARDVEVLKTVLAVALLAESHGQSKLGACLASSVEKTFGEERTWVPEVDMKELIILVLLALCHSYRDDDVIAWRTSCLAVLGSLQLGLHRWDTWLKTGGIFPGELERSWAINLFWCIYVLNKELSFQTGLPFSLQDSDLDPSIPEPTERYPYLTCMISFCRLGSKIWNLVVGWGNSTQAVTSDNCAYLTFQIQQWQDSIPEDIRLNTDWDSWSLSAKNDRLATLQVSLYLRANQLGILIYKQNLLGSKSIEKNLEGARIAIERARDTVETLDNFSRVSPIYSNRPQPFNQFLFSALAALFLAVLHAPNHFSQLCRADFYQALDIVKRCSIRNRQSRRLQKVIKNLKHINMRRQLKPSAGTVSQSTNAAFPAPTPLSVSDNVAVLPDAGPVDSNSVHTMPSSLFNDESLNEPDDFTDFFELAGGYLMDPQLSFDTSLEQISLSQDETSHLQSSADAFHAEDEVFTRLMAGLL